MLFQSLYPFLPSTNSKKLLYTKIPNHPVHFLWLSQHLMTNNLIFPFHSFQPIQVSRYHARSLSFRFLIRLMRPLLHFTRIYQSTTSISCMHCTKDVLYWSFDGDGVWHGMERKREWHESNLKKHDDKHFGVCTNSKIPLLSNLKFQSACLLAGYISWVNSYLLWKAAPTIPCRNSLRFFRSTCFSVKLQKKRQEWIFRVWIYECVLGVCVYNNGRLCLNAAPKSGRDPQYLKKSNENLRVVLIGYSLRLYFYEDDFLFV